MLYCTCMGDLTQQGMAEHRPAVFLLKPSQRTGRQAVFSALSTNQLVIRKDIFQHSFKTQLHNMPILSTPRTFQLHRSRSAVTVAGLIQYWHCYAFDDQSLPPAPRCGWLWSPWCHVPAVAVNSGVWNRIMNYRTDYIPGSFPARGANLFLRNINITKHVE